MNNIVDLKEHITSKNVRIIFEDANTVFLENSDNVSKVLLPSNIQISDFPYDEDVYNKLKEEKNIGIAESIYGLLLGFWFKSNNNILNLTHSSRDNLLDLNTQTSGILLRSSFEYYSLLYYVLSKTIFHFENKDWENILKILLKASFGLNDLTRDKFYTSPPEFFFHDLGKTLFKKDIEPIQIGETLNYLNKKINWSHLDMPLIDKIEKEEFKREYYSYLSEITHPVGIQSKLPDFKSIKMNYSNKDVHNLEDFFNKITMSSNNKSFNDIDYKLYEYLYYYSRILSCLNYIIVINSRTLVLLKEIKNYIFKNKDVINKYLNNKIGYEILFKVK
jgi:hypothetical protein